jgi:hypothetical protein
MPTATAASNAKVTQNPDPAGFAFKIRIRYWYWIWPDMKIQIWYIPATPFENLVVVGHWRKKQK